jgi:hypothetical protein
MRIDARVLVTVVAAFVIGCATTDSNARGPQGATDAKGAPAVEGASGPQNAGETQALEEFRKRIDTYVSVHKRLEATLPGRPKETTPDVIDKHQRALAQLIQKERATAKRGDIISPEAERVMKSVLGRIFGGPDGKQLKSSIMDENPAGVKVSVNGRYPDEVPLSTVPPQVLASLPKLPEEIEYRFVGNRLVLLDVHAHIILDYIDNALPA